jgi:hypothetical protein
VRLPTGVRSRLQRGSLITKTRNSESTKEDEERSSPFAFSSFRVFAMRMLSSYLGRTA